MQWDTLIVRKPVKSGFNGLSQNPHVHLFHNILLAINTIKNQMAACKPIDITTSLALYHCSVNDNQSKIGLPPSTGTLFTVRWCLPIFQKQS